MLVATTQPSPLLLQAIPCRTRGPTSPQEGTGHPTVVPPAPGGHDKTCSHPYLLPLPTVHWAGEATALQHGESPSSLANRSQQGLEQCFGSTVDSYSVPCTLPAPPALSASHPSSVPGKEKKHEIYIRSARASHPHLGGVKGAGWRKRNATRRSTHSSEMLSLRSWALTQRLASRQVLPKTGCCCWSLCERRQATAQPTPPRTQNALWHSAEGKREADIHLEHVCSITSTGHTLWRLRFWGNKGEILPHALLCSSLVLVSLHQ